MTLMGPHRTGLFAGMFFGLAIGLTALATSGPAIASAPSAAERPLPPGAQEALDKGVLAAKEQEWRRGWDSNPR